MQTEGSILGNSVARVEDPMLLRGSEAYFDDIQPDGLAYVHFVRSTIAHARLTDVDVEDARSMPGVIAVHTAADLDLADIAYGFGDPAFARPLVARDTVRFVGDIVAVVVAETRAQAADAAEAVFVDFEELDVLIDMSAALTQDAPLLFPDAGTNACFRTALGEDDDPLADAEHVTALRIESQRLAGVPIEGNGAVAVPDGDSLMLWIPSQNPHAAAGNVSKIVGIDSPALRVAVPKAMGGGFGSKAGIGPEGILVAALARRLARPLKWTETRSENMVAMFQGRAMILDARLGLSADGRITGLDVALTADCGAYPAIGAILPTFTQTMIQGVYDIPKVRFVADSVVTNTTPIAAYRGAGRPEATQMLERILDMAAVELGLDPVDIRRSNFIEPDAFPFTTVSGANYDNGEYAQALDAALAAADYESLRREQAEMRAAGSRVQLGIGVATYVEVTAPAGLHVEFGSVEVNDDGTVTARVGTSAHGQGHITSFSMIVSELLGVPMEDITILQSDTGEVRKGVGTMGSRSLQTAGSAVYVASEAVLDKARQLAGHLLEASPDDIVVGGGGLHVAGVPANGLSWAELAQAANDADRRPADMEAGLTHELDFDGSDATFPFGAHVAVVEVDTETGGVRVRRHVAVDDAGRLLNPMLVAGQQHGGIAQGIAQALFEAVRYDEFGNPVTANLADYTIPAASEFPSFETSNIETPTFRNPLGAKGIGESGTIGSTPAVHNAVLDALSPFGVAHLDMPLTPQRIWEAVNAPA